MSNWVSIKDKLPEEECLCFGYQSNIIIGYLHKEMLSEDYFCENESTILENVTHWQPLPEKPKDSTDG